MQKKHAAKLNIKTLLCLLTIASSLSCGAIEHLRHNGTKNSDKSPENTPSTTAETGLKDALSVKKEALRKSAADATAASQTSAAAISCSDQQERFGKYTEGSRASVNITFHKCLDEAKDDAARESCLTALQTGLDTYLVQAKQIFGC